MAVAFRAADTIDIQTTNNNITLNKPTGTADGDFLLAVFTLDNATDWTVNPPTLSGWTPLTTTTGSAHLASTDDGHALYCLYKIASGEGASWTFTHNSNQRRTGQVFAFSGVDGTTPLDGVTPSGANSNAANTSVVNINGTAITTGTNNAMVVQVSAGDPDSSGTSTWGAPSGYSTGGSDGSTFNPVAVFYKTQASAGTTGTVTSTLTFSSGGAGWMAIVLSLRPAGGGGGGSTTTKVMTETMVLADAEIDVLRFVRVPQDTMTLADAIVPYQRRVRIAEDVMTLADGFVSMRRLRRIIDDGLSVIDSFVKNVVTGGQVITTKVMSEALTLLDSFLDIVRFVRFGSDTLVMSDGDRFKTTILTTDENIDLSDGVVEWRRLKRLIADNLDLIDGFSKTLVGQNIVYIKVLSDTITAIDDTGQRWVLRKSQLTDTTVLSDAVVRALARIRILGEYIEYSDGVLTVRRNVRVAEDDLTTFDDTQRTLQADQVYQVQIVFGSKNPFRFGGR